MSKILIIAELIKSEFDILIVLSNFCIINFPKLAAFQLNGLLLLGV